MIHNYQNREIRIFLSSTFEDLMEERDFLLKKTFQRLRTEASSRNVNLTVLDLRWGVTEEETKSGKVVKVCIEEIMNSHPFFIGLVGDRYGWCPKDDEIAEDVKSEYEWLKDDIKNELSITEIEMQFGALRRSDDDTRAVFFVRSNFDVLKERDNIDKFLKFRQKVLHNERFPVFEFSSIKDLDSLIYKTITNLLDELYPKQSLTPHQQERQNQDSYVSRRKLNYIENESYYKEINDFVNNPDSSILTITSESGLGKTSLLANWLMKEADKSNMTVSSYFVGCGGNGINSSTILQYFIDDICEQFNYDINKIRDKPETVNYNTKDILSIVLKEVTAGNPVLFIIDGVNQLIDYDEDKALGWLPQLPFGSKIILSTIENDITYQSLKKKDCKFLYLHPLNLEERSLLIQKYLGYYGKKLSYQQLERVVHDVENENTLILCSLLDELIGFGSFTELDKTIDFYLQANSILDFFLLVLSRYAKDFGNSFVRDVLSLIYLSHHGLTESEIINIVECTNLAWSEFYCAFKNFFINKSGFLDFAHSYIREAVKAKYIDNEDEFCAYCRKRIIKGVRTTIGNYYTQRECSEIPFQYYNLNKNEELHSFLIDGVFPLTHLYAHEKESLLIYWQKLQEENTYSYADYLTIDTDAIQTDLLQDSQNRSNFIVYGYFDKLIDLSLLKDKSVAENAAIRGLAWINTYLKGSKDFFVPSFEYRFYKKMANVYQYWGDMQDAKACLKKMLEIVSSNKDHYGKTTEYAEVLLNLGHICTVEGGNEEAQILLNAALEICKKAVGEVSLETSDCYLRLGELYMKMHEYEKAIDHLEKSVKTKTQLYGKYDSSIPYHELGNAYIHCGRIKDAEQQLINLKNVCNLCSDLISDIPSINNMGLLYEEFGKYRNIPQFFEKATRYLEKATSISEKKCGKLSPMTISLKLNLIGNYCRNDKPEKALVVLLDVLKVKDNLPLDSSFHCNKQAGAIYCKLQQYEESKLYLLKALEQSISIYGEDSIETAQRYSSIAALYAYMKDFSSALSSYDNAVKIYELNNKKNDSDLIEVYLGKATICFKDFHKYKEAADNYHEALNICLELYGAESRKTTWFYFKLGESYQMAYMYNEAYVALSNAYNGYKEDYERNGRDYASMMATLSRIVEVQVKLGLIDYAKTNVQILFDDYCSIPHKEGAPQGDVYYLMGLIKSIEGENKEAMTFYVKSLSIRVKCLADDSNELKKTYLKVAESYEIAGEYEKALHYYFNAIPLIEKYYGEKSLDMAEVYNNIGGIYMKQDNEDYDKAFEYCEKGLNIKLDILGKNNSMVAMSYVNRGILQYYRNEYEQTIIDCKEAVSIYGTLNVINHEYVASCNDYIGMAFYRLGKKQEGDEYFDKSLFIRKSLYPEGDGRILKGETMKWLVGHTVVKARAEDEKQPTIPKKKSFWSILLGRKD